MISYYDKNYYITFGERRQSSEEWIVFDDEMDGKYAPSYDATSGLSIMDMTMIEGLCG